MRVDDNDPERVYEEARAQDRKLQQLQTERRTDEDTAFDKALSGRRNDLLRPVAVPPQKASLARSAVQKAVATQKDAKRVKTKPANAEAEVKGDSLLRNIRGSVADGHTDTPRAVASLAAQTRSSDAAQAGAQREGVAAGQNEGQGKLESKKSEQKEEARTEARVSEANLHGSDASADATHQVGGARREKDGGGGQGQGKQEEQKPESFRLPPQALMAPPPIARPKEAPQLSRLRAFAQEIAEKIVKHVRVGTNKMGLPEFQIELKSDILKGLKVKVSGRHGRIRAQFSSKDLAVLRQLRGEMASLREALSARGLKVDALDVEEERA